MLQLIVEIEFHRVLRFPHSQVMNSTYEQSGSVTQEPKQRDIELA